MNRKRKILAMLFSVLFACGLVGMSMPVASEVQEGSIVSIVDDVTVQMLNLCESKMSRAGNEKIRVAVLGISFEDDDTILGELFAYTLSTKLANRGITNWEILTRQKIEELEEEYELLNAQETVDLGAALGADYIITGSIFKIEESAKIVVQLIKVEGGVILGGTDVTVALTDELEDMLKSETIPRNPDWDQFEPDNAPADANDLAFGETVTGHTLKPGSDVDWYVMEIDGVEDGGSLKLTCYSEGTTDTIMGLYGPDSPDTLIMEDDDGGNDVNAKIMTIISQNGTYWLKVNGYDADAVGPYTLTAFVEVATLDEYEPDDSGAEATTLVPDQNQDHSILPIGDEDWYVVQINNMAGDNTLMTIETFGSTDTVMNLYGPNDASVFIAEDDDTGSENNAKIEYVIPQAGTYYIKVRHYESEKGIGDYTIGLKLNTVNLDAFEPDNDSSVAKEIPTNGTIQDHSLMPANDVDWLKFTLTEIKSVTIETQGELDTYIALFGPNDATAIIAEDDDSGTDFNAKIQERNLNPGTYYIRVAQPENIELSSGAYRISVTQE